NFLPLKSGSPTAGLYSRRETSGMCGSIFCLLRAEGARRQHVDARYGRADVGISVSCLARAEVSSDRVHYFMGELLVMSQFPGSQERKAHGSNHPRACRSCVSSQFPASHERKAHCSVPQMWWECRSG